jgi:hypothetical protein
MVFPQPSHPFTPCIPPHRLPKEIPLRMLGVGMSLPVDPSLVNGYLHKLRRAAARLLSAQKQLYRDTKLAIDRADIDRAVDRCVAVEERAWQAPCMFVAVVFWR